MSGVVLERQSRTFFLQESVRQSWQENLLWRFDPSTDNTALAISCIDQLTPEERTKTVAFIRGNFGTEANSFGIRLCTDYRSPITVSSTYFGLKVLEKLGAIEEVLDTNLKDRIVDTLNRCREEDGYKEDRYGKTPTIEATVRAFEIYEMLGTQYTDTESSRPSFKATTTWLQGHLDERWLYYNFMVADFVDRHGELDDDYLQKTAALLAESEANNTRFGSSDKNVSGVYVDLAHDGEVTTFSPVSGIRLLKLLRSKGVAVHEPDSQGLYDFIMLLYRKAEGGFAWDYAMCPDIEATANAKEMLEYLAETGFLDPEKLRDLNQGIERYVKSLQAFTGGFVLTHDTVNKHYFSG